MGDFGAHAVACEDEVLALQQVDDWGDLVLHMRHGVCSVLFIVRLVRSSPPFQVECQAEIRYLAGDVVENAGGTSVVVEEDVEGSAGGGVFYALLGFPGEESLGGCVAEAFAGLEAKVYGAQYGVDVLKGLEALVSVGGAFVFGSAAGHLWVLLFLGLRR